MPSIYLPIAEQSVGIFSLLAAGVWLFALLKRLGQIDLVISLSYVGFLGSVGFLMIFVTANVTLLQALTTHSVDLLLALIVLAVCAETTGALALPPDDLFSLD